MCPLLLSTLPDIVENELLRSQQTPEICSSLAPLEGEFARLEISDGQEDEERI